MTRDASVQPLYTCRCSRSITPVFALRRIARIVVEPSLLFTSVTEMWYGVPTVYGHNILKAECFVPLQHISMLSVSGFADSLHAIVK